MCAAVVLEIEDFVDFFVSLGGFRHIWRAVGF